VIVSDPTGRITFLNAEAERLTGWKDSEAFGAPLNSVFRIVNEESGQPVDSPGDRALQLGTATGLAGRTLLIAKDGGETPIDDSAAPVRRHGGPILGIVLVFRDISQQRKGQEAMERLAAIVESSEDAIFSNSLDGTIRTWNLGAQRMFGYTPEEIIRKPLTLLLPAERLPEEEQNLQRLKTGGRVAALETMRLTRDGRALDVSVTVSALKSEAGAIIGVSQIVRDITERKRAQSELQRLNAELERRVTERTRSLQEATEQLNAFCYSVAHDLQAPLRAQLAFAQVLLEDFGGALGSAGRDYLERIAQSADRQGRLVRDLLAHVSLSRTDLPMEAVDLAKAVDRVRLDLHSEIQNHQASINVGPLAGKVLANPSSLHLVITNLISNALKFVARETPAWVRVWSEQKNGSVRLWVEDKGIGIPPKYLGKIFGVFQRLHTIDEYPGTGIGLAIVKKAVERMSGRVGVESQPGAGSRFWVELREAGDAQERIAPPRDRIMLPSRGFQQHSPQVQRDGR
jgi:PAS domain S-box-containing protein